MSKRREWEYPIDSEDEIHGAQQWIDHMARLGLPAGRVILRIGRERRTLDQNAKLWPMLDDVSKQIEWVKDGERCYMRKEEWKDLFTASLRSQSMSPGIDGGMVILGLHTSTLPKRQFSDLVELIYEFGNQRDVKWSEPAKKAYDEYGHKDAA